MFEKYFPFGIALALSLAASLHASNYTVTEPDEDNNTVVVHQPVRIANELPRSFEELKAIAEDSDNPRAVEAAAVLLKSENKAAMQVVESICDDKNHKQRYEITKLCSQTGHAARSVRKKFAALYIDLMDDSICDYECAYDIDRALQDGNPFLALLSDQDLKADEITKLLGVAQNAAHPRSFDAAYILLEARNFSGASNVMELDEPISAEQQIAKDAIHNIFKNPAHKYYLKSAEYFYDRYATNFYWDKVCQTSHLKSLNNDCVSPNQDIINEDFKKASAIINAVAADPKRADHFDAASFIYSKFQKYHLEWCDMIFTQPSGSVSSWPIDTKDITIDYGTAFNMLLAISRRPDHQHQADARTLLRL